MTTAPEQPAHPAAQQACDLLLRGGAALAMDADFSVIDDAAIAIAGKRIAAIGPRLRSRPPSRRAARSTPRADIACVDAQAPGLGEPTDVHAAIAWGAQGSHVEHVVVGGELVLKGGRPQRADAQEVVSTARAVSARLWRKASVR